MREETPPEMASSSPANRDQKPDCRTQPAGALSPCPPAAPQKLDSAAVAAERASAKAMAPAADCKEKGRARAEKARAAAPIPTPTEEFRPTPARVAREPVPPVRPPYPASPCKAALLKASRCPVSELLAATLHRTALDIPR